MLSRRWPELVAWAVTFGLVTWWVTTEGKEGPGIAAATGAVAASAVGYGIIRLRE